MTTKKIELDPYEDDLEEDEPSLIFIICVFICNVVSSIFDRS